MTVRIGSITLTGVQDLYTEEARALVEQRAPEQQGGVMQDLGREPLSLVVAGLLYSAEALADLERLRQAQVKGEPQRFAADIVVGSEITRVLVAEARIQQLAGYANRYRYVLRLREYNDPPQSRQVAQAKVQAKASAVGASRAADGVKAAALLKDPSGLPQALEKQPGLLKRLKAKDLASALGRGLSSLSSEQVVGILSAVASRDPSKLGAVFQSMLSSGQIAGMVASLTSSGLDLKAMLSASQLANLGALGASMQFLMTFLKELPALIAELKVLFDDLSGVMDLFRGLEQSLQGTTELSTASIQEGPKVSTTSDSVLEHLRQFLSRLGKLCSAQSLEQLGVVARSLKCQAQFLQGLKSLRSGLQKLVDSVNVLAALSAQFDAVLAGLDVLMGVMKNQAGNLLLNLEKLFTDLTGLSAWSGPLDVIQVKSLMEQASSRGDRIRTLLAEVLPSMHSLAELATTLVGLMTNLERADSTSPQPETRAVAPNTS